MNFGIAQDFLNRNDVIVQAIFGRRAAFTMSPIIRGESQDDYFYYVEYIGEHDIFSQTAWTRGNNVPAESKQDFDRKYPMDIMPDCFIIDQTTGKAVADYLHEDMSESEEIQESKEVESVPCYDCPETQLVDPYSDEEVNGYW